MFVFGHFFIQTIKSIQTFLSTVYLIHKWDRNRKRKHKQNFGFFKVKIKILLTYCIRAIMIVNLLLQGFLTLNHKLGLIPYLYLALHILVSPSNFYLKCRHVKKGLVLLALAVDEVLDKIAVAVELDVGNKVKFGGNHHRVFTPQTCRPLLSPLD